MHDGATGEVVSARVSPRPARSRVAVALRIAAVIGVIVYPLCVYAGLSRLGARSAALFLLLIAGAHTLFRSLQLQRLAWRSALWIPLCACAFLLDDKRYVLAAPVLINAGLFATFFGSLRGPMPIVERFARMQVKDLTHEELVYCRSVTKLWSAFFVFNAATAGALAVLGALELWTLYTGLVAYILVGLLAASEYTVRKYRFGRFGNGLHDRMLRALLPSRSTPP